MFTLDNNQSDKLSKLLSDPQSLSMLASLARSFMLTGNTGTQVADKHGLQPDETSLQEVHEDTQITSSILPKEPLATPIDDRANLLLSIKPYLKAERQPKVDSLLKAINIANMISNYTQNNK